MLIKITTTKKFEKVITPLLDPIVTTHLEEQKIGDEIIISQNLGDKVMDIVELEKKVKEIDSSAIVKSFTE